MNLLLTVFCLGSFFWSSEAVELDSDVPLHLLNAENVIQHGGFSCPFPFGTFADPGDCGKFYICVMNKAINRNCGRGKKFDILRRTCLPSFIAICFDKDKSSTSTSTTTTTLKPTGVTSGMFFCPSLSGLHPDPNDCSKYYKCTFFIASSKTCPETELFDAIEKACKPANVVNCGDRKIPGQTTVDDTTNQPITEPPTTVDLITNQPITEPTTVDLLTNQPSTEPTTVDLITNQPRTEPTTVVVTEEQTHTTTDLPQTVPDQLTSTDKVRLTVPPETDCTEDDVDCLIDEMGDPDDWFKCPEDIGSYPHPTSDKLFIFCMNWIPSVKKCGLNMVFSKEQFTCIEP